MEPRFFKRGNSVERGVSFNLRGRLQWNHVFSNVEICTSGRTLINPLIASMEPRFFKRGNKGFGNSGIASTSLQWNHVFSNVEISCGRQRRGRRRTSFNGTTFFQTWKFLFPFLLRFGEIGFNGTTFFQTWKFFIIYAIHNFLTVASMEPRFFKRGNKIKKSSFAELEVASMEPRFFKRGNAFIVGGS